LTPTNLSRIEWLSREYPGMVERDEDGRQVVVVSRGEKVGDVMKLVGNLTEEWAADNNGYMTREDGEPIYRGSKHAGGSLSANPNFLKDYKLPVGME
jgi:hypothetical protein